MRAPEADGRGRSPRHPAVGPRRYAVRERPTAPASSRAAPRRSAAPPRWRARRRSLAARRRRSTHGAATCASVEKSMLVARSSIDRANDSRWGTTATTSPDQRHEAGREPRRPPQPEQRARLPGSAVRRRTAIQLEHRDTRHRQRRERDEPPPDRPARPDLQRRVAARPQVRRRLVLPDQPHELGGEPRPADASTDTGTPSTMSRSRWLGRTPVAAAGRARRRCRSAAASTPTRTTTSGHTAGDRQQDLQDAPQRRCGVLPVAPCVMPVTPRGAPGTPPRRSPRRRAPRP